VAGVLVALAAGCGNVPELDSGRSPTTPLPPLPTSTVVPPGGPSTLPPGWRGPVVVLGDSLTWDTAPSLEAAFRAAGWGPVVVDAFPGRQVTDDEPDPFSGLVAAKRLVLERDVRDAPWVVALGTNDIGPEGGSEAENRAAVEELLDFLGSGTRVLWVDVWRTDLAERSFAYNLMLADLAGTRANLEIIPWAGEAWVRPEWFEEDGIHLTADGMAARDRFLVERVTAAVPADAPS
jgi:lysophospholipase L1-like esterase